jgi:hypothetical protein
MTATAVMPWADDDQLNFFARVCSWLNAADDLMEAQLGSEAEGRTTVDRLKSVIDGDRLNDMSPLERALADLHADVTAGAHYAELGPLWREKLVSMLECNLRLCEAALAISRGAIPPTLDEYLDLADGYGRAFAVVSLWLVAGEPELPAHLDRLIPALIESQKSGRLANDLATHAREQATEMNALRLGIPIAQLRERRDQHDRRFRALLESLLLTSKPSAVALDRLTTYARKFYALSDLHVPTVRQPSHADQ